MVTNGITGTFIAAADLNHDGKLDLAVANASTFVTQGANTVQTTPGLTVLLGKGDGSFSTGQTLFTSYDVMTVTVADVNRDGIPDLIAALSDTNFNYFIGVALGNGDGTFKTPVAVGTSFGPEFTAVTDLNGDGVPDLVVAHCCGDTNTTYLLGNGDGTFQTEVQIGGSSYDVHAVNLTGNGKPDLVISDHDTNSLEIMLSLTGPPPGIANVSGASFLAAPLAAESIATAFGTGLASGSATPSTIPLPTNVNGTVVTVTDSAGTARQAPIFFVSPSQVNYEVPAGTAAGIAKVSITSPTGQASGSVEIAGVAPAFFEANTVTALAAGSTLLVSPDGTQTPGNIVQVNSSGSVVASPIDLGTAGDQVYLTLYATGVRHASSLAGVMVSIGGASAPVQFAGPQGTFDGLDQVNVLIPTSLAGKGQVDVLMSVDGVDAPPVVISIR